MFWLHFISFYAFSGTNLLTRCHIVSSLFSAVFRFRKVIKEILLELDETKTQGPILPDTITKSKEETEEGTGVPSPGGGVGLLPGTPPRGEQPPGLHRPCPFAYKLLFAGKP